MLDVVAVIAIFIHLYKKENEKVPWEVSFSLLPKHPVDGCLSKLFSRNIILIFHLSLAIAFKLMTTYDFIISTHLFIVFRANAAIKKNEIFNLNLLLRASLSSVSKSFQLKNRRRKKMEMKKIYNEMKNWN